MSANSCLFCTPTDVVLRSELSYVRYDSYPVNPGHVLIIPYRHVDEYFSLEPEEKQDMFALLEQAKTFLDARYEPGGYNIGVNVGKTAGQSIMHVHVHLIPRYSGDMENPRGGVRGVIPDKQKY